MKYFNEEILRLVIQLKLKSLDEKELKSLYKYVKKLLLKNDK